MVLALAVVAGACGGNGDACQGGLTKVCLADGTSCACAPSCSAGQAACAQYALCGANQTCTPCIGTAPTNDLPSTCRVDDSVLGCGPDTGYSCTSSATPGDTGALSCSGGLVQGSTTQYCCAPLQSDACGCATGLCVPLAWMPGQSYTFELLGYDGGETPAPDAEGTPFDASVGPPNAGGDL
jgi:hypothetical protein